jgi:thiol-disulfide isomerase/thioredoxin
VSALLVGTGVAAAGAGISLSDLDGTLVNPLAPTPGARGTVVFFISAECPVSNRYAPEVQRLHEKYEAQGLRFFPIYANPNESDADVRTHVAEYGYPGRALRDDAHEFVKLVGATVTPEAALFDASGRLVYHGRIDNRYVSLGVERPSATVHDLDDAIAAALAGRPVAQPVTQAVGCFLIDFAR